MPGITHVPLHHKRPAIALVAAFLVRQQTKYTSEGWGLEAEFLCVDLELFFLVLKQGLFDFSMGSTK
jgi:hypothetical protein